MAVPIAGIEVPNVTLRISASPLFLRSFRNRPQPRYVQTPMQRNFPFGELAWHFVMAVLSTDLYDKAYKRFTRDAEPKKVASELPEVLDG
jgi:hypothetical protein